MTESFEILSRYSGYLPYLLKDVDPADESVNLAANTRKGSRNYCSRLTTLRENLETQEAEKWKIWLSKDLS